MRKLSLIFILLMGFLFPASARADGEVHLSLLTAEILPEYDQPSVLMIYRLTLAPGSTLPANLAIRIPANSQINAVAVMDPGNNLLDAPHDTSMQGKWSVIKMMTNSLKVQVEYYVPLLKNGTVRHIVFEWAGDYAVDKLEANFHRPAGAENVSLSLTPVLTSPGQDGLTNYAVQTTNLAAGQTYSLTIDYNRQTDTLNNSGQPVQAITTPGPDTPGRARVTDILIWVLGGIGVLLLLVVAGIIWSAGKQRLGRASQVVRRHKPHKSEKEDEFTYCSQCGKRAQPGDAFCRTCGTRLKRGSPD
jgi:hypothetical protein